jgi:hypothetical protein
MILHLSYVFSSYVKLVQLSLQYPQWLQSRPDKIVLVDILQASSKGIYKTPKKFLYWGLKTQLTSLFFNYALCKKTASITT